MSITIGGYGEVFGPVAYLSGSELMTHLVSLPTLYLIDRDDSFEFLINHRVLPVSEKLERIVALTEIKDNPRLFLHSNICLTRWKRTL